MSMECWSPGSVNVSGLNKPSESVTSITKFSKRPSAVHESLKLPEVTSDTAKLSSSDSGKVMNYMKYRYQLGVKESQEKQVTRH